MVSDAIVDLLQIRPAANGRQIGELCGSTFLDTGFETWMAALVCGEQWSRLKAPAKKRMLSDFESVKRAFDPQMEPEYSVELKGVEDDEENGISGDVIVVPSTAIQSIFDNICSRILRLVEKQISQMKSKKRQKVKVIR